MQPGGGSDGLLMFQWHFYVILGSIDLQPSCFDLVLGLCYSYITAGLFTQIKTWLFIVCSIIGTMQQFSFIDYTEKMYYIYNRYTEYIDYIYYTNDTAAKQVMLLGVNAVLY